MVTQSEDKIVVEEVLAPNSNFLLPDGGRGVLAADGQFQEAVQVILLLLLMLLMLLLLFPLGIIGRL